MNVFLLSLIGGALGPSYHQMPFAKEFSLSDFTATSFRQFEDKKKYELSWFSGKLHYTPWN